MNAIVKVLLGLFLSIGVGVHLYGLAAQSGQESNLSHLVHTLSYGACLWAVLRARAVYALPLYVAGAVYPVGYHALCAYHTWAHAAQLHFICLLVVVVVPAAAVWLYRSSQP